MERSPGGGRKKAGSNSINLPKIERIDHYNMESLRSLLSQVICLVMNRAMPEYNNKTSIPPWWPQNIPWGNPNRSHKSKQEKNKDIVNVFLQCYKYYNKEDLITFSHASHLTADFKINSQLKIMQHLCSMSKGEASPRKKGCIPVYVCMFCEGDFYQKKDLVLHQALCSNNNNAESSPKCIEIDFNGKLIVSVENRDQVRLMNSHVGEQNNCSKEAEFLQLLNLIPTEKAKEIKNKKKDLHYTVEYTEPQKIPVSPSSTRKLLLTQSAPTGYKKYFDDEDDIESVSSNQSNSSGKSDIHKSLSYVDLCSAFGQKLLKNMEVKETPVSTNIDRYCHTPIKNNFREKLRGQGIAYPNVFKLTNKMRVKYSHTYKFTKRQRKNFMKYMKTGLNKRSRRLKKSVPKCYVRVKRLNQREIHKWITGKKIAVVKIPPLTPECIEIWTSPSNTPRKPESAKKQPRSTQQHTAHSNIPNSPAFQLHKSCKISLERLAHRNLMAEFNASRRISNPVSPPIPTTRFREKISNYNDIDVIVIDSDEDDIKVVSPSKPAIDIAKMPPNPASGIVAKTSTNPASDVVAKTSTNPASTSGVSPSNNLMRMMLLSCKLFPPWDPNRTTCSSLKPIAYVKPCVDGKLATHYSGLTLKLIGETSKELEAKETSKFQTSHTNSTDNTQPRMMSILDSSNNDASTAASTSRQLRSASQSPVRKKARISPKESPSPLRRSPRKLNLTLEERQINSSPYRRSIRLLSPVKRVLQN